MKKPVGQEGIAESVRPEAGEDAFAWLKDVPVHPLMVNPVAAMAATTAIGLGMASQFAGMMFGAMQGATEKAKAARDEAAEETPNAEPVKAKPVLTVVAKQPEPVAKAPVAKAAKPRAVKAKATPEAAADDLKAIPGIGPKLEQVLNGMGYRRYADIAALTAAAAKKIEAELGLDGRIARDGWVEQAKALAKGRG